VTSISGFWAGVYAYPMDALPPVNFDCELMQNGSPDIAYSGQISPKKDHIKGIWQAGGRMGSFEMHRDAGEVRRAETRETADELNN